MSILKGTNAAALYGSRATNGVIVITTKRGDGGKKGLGIQVGTSYTYDQRAYMPEYQNVFGGGSTPYFVANENGDYTYVSLIGIPSTTISGRVLPSTELIPRI